MMNKKVSVIIPMYNSEKYIKDCLNSVINQTYSNLEIIVIDDCSTDSSLELVRNIKDSRIKIIKFDENKGVSNARNKGIELAEGDYICFIDSDDIWVENKIEKQIEFIVKNDYAFIYSNYAFLDNKKLGSKKLSELNIKNDLKTTSVLTEMTYDTAIKNTAIFVSTVMLDVKKIKKEDMYMPNLKIGQDSVAWWHILKKGFVAHGMEDVLAFYRISGNSLSSNKFKAVVGAWKNYMSEDLRFYKKVYCFMCYIINAIARRL